VNNGRLPPPIPLRKLLEETEGLIIGGRRYRVPGCRVLTWKEHSVQFRIGQGFNKRRVEDVDTVGWHWTGGENEPLVMAETLAKRGYGVEFAIASGLDLPEDAFADLYQFADPLVVDTADIGKLNARSAGVEIVSYGVKSWDRAWQVPRRGADRRLEPQRIHGKLVDVAAFRRPQTRTARALAEVLSRALDIPREVPRLPNGRASGELLTDEQLAAFKGHIGHHNISAKKLDCGTHLLEDLFNPMWERAT
jgi:hypothetical protein